MFEHTRMDHVAHVVCRELWSKAPLCSYIPGLKARHILRMQDPSTCGAHGGSGKSLRQIPGPEWRLERHAGVKPTDSTHAQLENASKLEGNRSQTHRGAGPTGLKAVQMAAPETAAPADPLRTSLARTDAVRSTAVFLTRTWAGACLERSWRPHPV